MTSVKTAYKLNVFKLQLFNMVFAHIPVYGGKKSCNPSTRSLDATAVQTVCKILPCSLKKKKKNKKEKKTTTNQMYLGMLYKNTSADKT